MDAAEELNKKIKKRNLRNSNTSLSFSASLPDDVRGVFADSICAVKYSKDPFLDLRESIIEMINDVGVRDWDEMEELVYCYVVLNSSEIHGFIGDAFLSLYQEAELEHTHYRQPRKYRLPSGPVALPFMLLALAKGHQINTIFPLTPRPRTPPTCLDALVTSTFSGECISRVCRKEVLIVGGRLVVYRGWSVTTFSIVGTLCSRIVCKLSMMSKGRSVLIKSMLEIMSWILIAMDSVHLMNSPQGGSLEKGAAFGGVFVLICLHVLRKVESQLTKRGLSIKE
ncbi:hypothetical protein HHK36_008743 [Tetracentron sinense]|uniref:OVATE domain-containing protein n=1 Tax=Tetracentron sinense TaxID=13715 RepID=A0A835DJL4_TETSI|nr:hypothetical protein HHK36_008743 [Tetracentron sinense]